MSGPALTPGDGPRAVLGLSLLGGLLGLVLPLPLSSVPATLAVVLHFRRRKHLQWCHRWPGGRWDEFWPVAALTLAFFPLTLGVIHAWPALAEILARFEPLYESRHESGDTWGLALLKWALVLAVTEEVLFRGSVLQALRPRGDGQAVLASALLFDVLHGPGFLPPWSRG